MLFSDRIINFHRHRNAKIQALSQQGVWAHERLRLACSLSSLASAAGASEESLGCLQWNFRENYTLSTQNLNICFPRAWGSSIETSAKKSKCILVFYFPKQSVCTKIMIEMVKNIPCAKRAGSRIVTIWRTPPTNLIMNSSARPKKNGIFRRKTSQN